MCFYKSIFLENYSDFFDSVSDLSSSASIASQTDSFS